ncbi:MAG: ABC transporter ATP-binding protein [Candidatus Methanosuratincola sp.]|jgi:putative ABC transport system ATP-binding protein|nr:ABC transporter ATP-binding protein [Candidatus Methanosuratincola sp.]
MVAEDLWKVYRLGQIDYPALRGVSFSVKKGEYIAIVGPSGSGKSTLLNLMGALDRPTKGKMMIDGVEISKLNDKKLAELRNRKLGFVFQTFNLLSHMSAAENVETPLIAAGVPPEERRRRSYELLEMVGLKGFERNRPSMLSGGQQQKVAIARALANEPQIILADEPTGNLDSKSSHEIIEILRRLNEEKGVTIVMVTHNLELTPYCDKTWFFRDGKIEREEVRNAK